MKLNWANYPCLIKRSKRAGITGITLGLIGISLAWIPATKVIGTGILVFGLATIAYAHGLKDADDIIYKSHDVNKEEK